MIVLYILLAVVILLFMVLIHETGHYVAGRLLGFKIDEFSIGFGKALISKKNKRGELISLRIFPLGGYCAFAGEEDDKAVAGSFTSHAPWKRIIVFLAGVTFNFLTAIIFSFILLCGVGYDIPQFDQYYEANTSYVYTEDGNKYNFTIDDEAIPEAYRSSWNTLLQEDDVIFAVNGIKIDNLYSYSYPALEKAMQSALKSHIKNGGNLSNFGFGENKDGSVTFNIRRNGEYMDVNVPIIYTQLHHSDGSVAVDTEGNQKFITLFGFSSNAYKHSFWEALSRCVSFAFGLAWIVLKSLWLLITFQIPINQIGGPITTIATMASFTQQSFSSIFVLIPLLSANLAVFNALPFPALDGSHVLFTGIEWIRKKPINRKIENIIHMVGLGILFAFVIIVDILHFVLPS